MNKTERTQIEDLTTKVDLLYSLIANDLQAKQALQVHGAMNAQLKEQPDNTEALELVKKAYTAFVFHSESVTNGINFYSRIFGEESQKKYDKIRKDNPETVATAPTETKIGSTSTVSEPTE